MDQLPSPLTPADCDLRDFPRMMLDIQRLRTSEFDAIADDGAWRAGLNLWMSAFHNVPAASLADGDAAFCKAAGLGRDIATWRKVKNGAMRGWHHCNDGRWYHATLAEFALEAWLEKLCQRLTGGSGNAKRWGVDFDAAPLEAAIAGASAMLLSLNPASKVIAKMARRTSLRDQGGIAPRCQEDPDPIPNGSQERLKENGSKRDIKKEDKAPRLRLVTDVALRPDAFQLPEWIPVVPWEGFIAMRKKQRRAPTDEAMRLIVIELEKLRRDGHEPAAVLNQSIRNCWQDVYALKTKEDTRGTNKHQPAFNSFAASVSRVTRKRNPFGLNGLGGEVIEGHVTGSGQSANPGEGFILEPAGDAR